MKKWLQDYYGRDADLLNPEAVFEGKSWAVVKLTRTGMRGHSSLGYVLIQKTGRHSFSKHKPLFDGMPSSADMERMKKELERAEQD